MRRRATIGLLVAVLACSGPPGWETLPDPEGDVEPGDLPPAVADLADLTGVEVWATDPDLLVRITMNGAARSLAARRALPALGFQLSLIAPGANAEAEPAQTYSVALRLPPMPEGEDPTGRVVASFCDPEWRSCKRARGILTTLEDGTLDVQIPRSMIPELTLPFHYRVASYVERDLGFLDHLSEGFECLLSCGFGGLPPGADVAPDVQPLASQYARYPA